MASHRTRVSTAALNEVVREAVKWQPPPMTQGGAGRIYYASQVSHSPPTLCLFVNKATLFSINYKRYLERKFREGLGFEGSPLRFVWRGKRVRDLRQDRLRGAEGSPKGNPKGRGKGAAHKGTNKKGAAKKGDVESDAPEEVWRPKEMKERGAARSTVMM